MITLAERATEKVQAATSSSLVSVLQGESRWSDSMKMANEIKDKNRAEVLQRTRRGKGEWETHHGEG
jgi:hypothetical protein